MAEKGMGRDPELEPPAGEKGPGGDGPLAGSIATEAGKAPGRQKRKASPAKRGAK